MDLEYKEEYIMQPQLVYAGVDVAKTTLVTHCQGVDRTFPNTPEGRQQLLAWLATLVPDHAAVVCEATGGYEQPLVRAAQAGGVPCTVRQLARCRHYAKALGQLAKTDAIDARRSARMACAIQPTPKAAAAAVQQQLTTLTRQRQQLRAQLQPL
ncbi:MAG: transposase [Verrucomicrobiales bacterium]|nr:transposase [Verrucomicrobiales bacterium]